MIQGHADASATTHPSPLTSILAEAVAALSRIQHFLLLPESQESPPTDADGTCIVSGVLASWLGAHKSTGIGMHRHLNTCPWMVRALVQE